MKLFKENEYPWYSSYNDIPRHLDYPNGSMVDVIAETALKYPNNYAYEYFNNKCTYKKFLEKIESAARGLKALGVKKGDIVSICMPNTPEAIIMFYGVNMTGAIANMIHPLSSEKEIESYLKKSNSSVILTLDKNYKKVINVINNTNVTKIIVGSAGDDLKGLKKLMYSIFNADITKAVKKLEAVFLKAFRNREVLSYKKFIQRGTTYHEDVWCEIKGEDPAAILYSGGTSGTPKGIILTNLNFNAAAYQSHLMCDPSKEKDTVLSIMPIFHGFGLGVCIHTPLHIGMKCTLIPRFDARKLVKLIRKTRPNFLVGVPTLFEAITKNKDVKEDDFSSITCIVSGGDIMDEENYERYNKFFEDHGSKAKIRVGYGITEATTATCLSPTNEHRENSIGIPFPDMVYKIVEPGTTKEVKKMEDGEICISGPSIMKGYLNDEEETAKALQKHKDGLVYLHTGDLGYMDKDGFVYFKSRIKRMIVTSGYNVYPSYIENILNKHEYIASCSVIGIPDAYRGQKVKAYVVLKKEVLLTEEVETEIRNHCKKYISKYALPREYEFRKELPKTLVGKIAYTELEKENINKPKKENTKHGDYQ